jgi:ATP-dependent DNA helicase RecG
VFEDRRELSSSLLDQLEEAYAFIDRYNRIKAEIKGFDQIDIRDYPPEAIRETLLNAIVHRDLFVQRQYTYQYF